MHVSLLDIFLEYKSNINEQTNFYNYMFNLEKQVEKSHFKK